MLVNKVCYLRGIYFAVRKKTSIILLQLSTQTTRTNQSKVLHKLLILSINISRLLGVISYVRFLNSSFIFLSDSCGVFIDLKKALAPVDNNVLLNKLNFYEFCGS